MKKVIAFLAVIIVIAATTAAYAATPTIVWDETLGAPYASQSAYFGQVINNEYYTGFINTGPMKFGTSQIGGTSLVQSYTDTRESSAAGRAAKSSLILGGYLFYTASAGGIYRVDSDWSSNPTAIVLDGGPDSITTDGTYIFANSYASANRGNIYKYSVSNTSSSFTLTQEASWVITTASARLRSVSYYNGKIYAAESGSTGLYEVDAATGTSVKIINDLPTGIYQVQRYGNQIFAAGGTSFKIYDFNGTSWTNSYNNSLGNGTIYGIGVSGNGSIATKFWTTGANSRITYWNTNNSVPPPAPSGYVATGKEGTGILIYQANGGGVIQTISTYVQVAGLSIAPNGDIYCTHVGQRGVYKVPYIGEGVWGAEEYYDAFPEDHVLENLAAKSDGTLFVGTNDGRIYKDASDRTKTLIVDNPNNTYKNYDIELSPAGVPGDFWTTTQLTGINNYYDTGIGAGFDLIATDNCIRALAFANGKLYGRGAGNTVIHEYNPNSTTSGTPFIDFTVQFAEINPNPNGWYWLENDIISGAYGPDANGDGYGDFYFKYGFYDGSDYWHYTVRDIFVYSGAPGLTPTTRFLGKIENANLAGTYAIDVFPKGNQSAPPSGTLTCKLDLLNFEGDKTSIPVLVEVDSTSYTPVLDAEGNFSILDVANGTYDIRIKASHWLAKMTAGVIVTGDTVMDIVSLINGDVVDNNEVDFSDINAVRAAYGSFPGDETWNERADVDGSGEVDFTDINIVRSNYGEIGD